ncbi:hypothetical protein EDB89DRAFT_1955070, partial [Lactarius sanguifluus]
MTPAKSVLAAILLAAVGLSGPQLPQAWSRSSQKYDRSGRGLPARGAFGRYPTRPSLHLHPSHRAQRRASQTLFSLSPCPTPRLMPRHASKNFPSRPLHPPAVGLSSMTPTPTTRGTLHKSSLPTPFDVFCFRVRLVPCLALISYLMITACSTSPRLGHWQQARQTAKRCFATPYYYYPAYLIVLP